eukprot:2585873-Alexandrium_andersonii.AAC.1
MSASLVGSEMCIRDSSRVFSKKPPAKAASRRLSKTLVDGIPKALEDALDCLLYTSDAADDM